MIGLIKAIAQAVLVVSKKADKAAEARARYSILREPANDPGSPEVIELKDYASGISAAVAPSEGGGLGSFRVRYRGFPVELLHRTCDYSNGGDIEAKAVFLCPVIQPQGGERITWHDFAGELNWKETWNGVDTEGAGLILELHRPPSGGLYPFGFVVRAAYELGKGRLTITYTVSAAAGNHGPMPFCVGCRIAFALPFLTGTAPGAMLFQTAGAGTPFATRAQLGDFEALEALDVIAGEGIPSATLIDQQGISVRISQYAAGAEGAPASGFSIRGGPRLGYLCLEPRFGRPAADWKDRVVMLSPGHDFHWMVELQPEVALALPGADS